MSLQGYIPGKTINLQKAIEIPPASPVGWGSFGSIYDMGNLALIRAAYDSTNHGGSFYRDNLKGVYEKIEHKMSLNYTSGGYTFMRDLLDLLDEDPGDRWWRIKFPEAHYITFMASVSHVEDLTPRDERITYDIVLTISEVVTFS